VELKTIQIKINQMGFKDGPPISGWDFEFICGIITASHLPNINGEEVKRSNLNYTCHLRFVHQSGQSSCHIGLFVIKRQERELWRGNA
jgi:hypothetical protein